MAKGDAGFLCVQTEKTSVKKVRMLLDFISRFHAADTVLDTDLVVKKENRFFLINTELRLHIQKDFFYAGAYLGKAKGNVFFPSFILLAMMAEKKTNRVAVDDKGAWLFICGRDIFKRGILNVVGSVRKGDYTLVVNRRMECLGFGRITRNIDDERDVKRVVVKNISDVGDFLRREKSKA